MSNKSLRNSNKGNGMFSSNKFTNLSVCSHIIKKFQTRNNKTKQQIIEAKLKKY